MKKVFLTALLCTGFLFLPGIAATEEWKLPPLPPEENFGNLLLDRVASSRDMEPVGFSHWIHRRKFQCKVCHGELDFAMEKGVTEITEAAIRDKRYCGACHSGWTAFPVDDNCSRCHRGSAEISKEKYLEKATLSRPSFGYGLNWVVAVESGQIEPRSYLREKPEELTLDRDLVLHGWNFVPPAIFPHGTHTEAMECNSCHPDLFTVKRKGTEEFSMRAMLEGRFCGYCHGKVSFPLDDCQRCHPGLRNRKL